MANPNSIQRHKAAARRAEVWRLRTEEGMTQAEIAARFAVTQSTIAKDLKFISEKTMANLEDIATVERRIQAVQLQQIAAEALQAWGASKKPHKRVQQKSQAELLPTPFSEFNDPAHPNYQKEMGMRVVRQDTSTMVSESAGNAQYLQTALAAMRSLRELLGLNAPIQVDANWKMQLEAAGLDASAMFESLVQSAYEQLQVPDQDDEPGTG